MSKGFRRKSVDELRDRVDKCVERIIGLVRNEAAAEEQQYVREFLDSLG